MSVDEQQVASAITVVVKKSEPTDEATKLVDNLEWAKDLYSLGSRNLLVKNYAEAADELSQVCSLYEDIYGTFSNEIGMPYLLYAKSLIALALEENKVIDVGASDEKEDDDEEELGEDDDTDDEGGEVEENEAGNDAAEAETNGEAAAAAPSTSNGAAAKLNPIKEPTVGQETSDEADSTHDGNKTEERTEQPKLDKITEEAQVSSTEDRAETSQNGAEKDTNGQTVAAVSDGEKPSTSNGVAENCNEAADETEEYNEAASSLQLAWELLELAAKIFARQGISGLPNLAEVHTELANIEFENNILDGARDDYEKALRIYAELPTNYRRAKAEVHYKIGLTYLIDQLYKEAATSLKEACSLIEAEIEEINAKGETTEKDQNTIKDLEETKVEIWAKITEIEETQAQTIVQIRAALDNFAKPSTTDNDKDAGPSSSIAATGALSSSSSSSSSAISSSSSKPKDISHLIKRKKPEEPTSEAEAASSPAKRAAL